MLTSDATEHLQEVDDKIAAAQVLLAQCAGSGDTIAQATGKNMAQEAQFALLEEILCGLLDYRRLLNKQSR